MASAVTLHKKALARQVAQSFSNVEQATGFEIRAQNDGKQRSILVTPAKSVSKTRKRKNGNNKV